MATVIVEETNGRMRLEEQDRGSQGAVVLLVDDEPIVASMLARMLEVLLHTERQGRPFNKVEILSATSLEQAEQIMEVRCVTHVVCDYNLGTYRPRGTQMLQDWRKRFPSIRRSVLHTASRVDEDEVGPWIDAVVRKAEKESLSGILHALFGL